jgi:hypothetical protein
MVMMIGFLYFKMNCFIPLTAASAAVWNEKGKVDHDITRVVSGISDTAYVP